MATEKAFTAVHVDFDREITLWQVYGCDTTDVMRRFLLDVHPESEGELCALKTYEELVKWASNIDCQVDLLPLN